MQYPGQGFVQNPNQPFNPNNNRNYGVNEPNYNYMPQGRSIPMVSSPDERIWVTSQGAAEAYLVAANGFVRLWDSSTNRFYEKSADYSGRPYPMKIYEYKEVTGQPMPATESDFVCKDEFEEFRNKVDEFINSFDSEE